LLEIQKLEIEKFEKDTVLKIHEAKNVQ